MVNIIMFSTHGSVKDQIVPLGISYVIEKQFKIDKFEQQVAKI